MGVGKKQTLTQFLFFPSSLEVVGVETANAATLLFLRPKSSSQMVTKWFLAKLIRRFRS